MQKFSFTIIFSPFSGEIDTFIQQKYTTDNDY